MSQSSPELPDRIQRDLEEALREGGVDKLPSRPRRRRSFRLGVPDPRPKDPGQLVLIGVGLFLLGYFVFRGAGIGGYLILAGIACVVLAVVSHFVQPQGAKPKYWRGKYLDVPTGTWQDRLYRLIYRRP
jgi:hypothetical protein